MIEAALNGELDKVATSLDPNFGVAVPTACPNVPSEVLDPRNTWANKAAYDTQAKVLAGMFVGNFTAFADDVSSEIRQAGPRV